MNVNSHGHNLDTKKSQLFPEIKHPPDLKNPVGVPSPSDWRKNNPKVSFDCAQSVARTGQRH
jgi:hypothetical protein